MCRNTTGRREWKPLGDQRRAAARSANIMVSRVVMLVMFLMARGVMVLLEQPTSSVMWLPGRG
eukprot:7672810-Alexandrium_andersonii.AAC.1